MFPVGLANAVVIAPRIAIQIAPEAEPTSSTMFVSQAPTERACHLQVRRPTLSGR
jgi:hypothetical protein